MNATKVVFLQTLLFFIVAATGISQSPGDGVQTLTQAVDDSGRAPGDTAQMTGDPGEPAGDQEQTSAEGEVKTPDGFAEIEMGMDLARVKELLKRDPQFAFRGDPDVSLLARPNESLIETEGMTFIDRAYFQFYEGRLYTIIITLKQDRLDHFTMYTELVDQYGEPTSLDPTEVVWEFEEIRMVLERPLSVKYIDTLVFNEILRQNAQTESLRALSRERFLDQF